MTIVIWYDRIINRDVDCNSGVDERWNQGKW